MGGTACLTDHGLSAGDKEYFAKRQNARIRRGLHSVLFIAIALYMALDARSSTTRTAVVFYPGQSTAQYLPMMALDTAHKQIFTAWSNLNRVDVLSTVDFHLIRSIDIGSPYSLDISPDNSTIAVANGSTYVQFFSTTTYGKTGQVVFDNLEITYLVYTAKADLLIQSQNLSQVTTALWNHVTNALEMNNAVPGTSPYENGWGLGRNSDYSVLLLNLSGGNFQFLDGTTALPLPINKVGAAITSYDPLRTITGGTASKGGSLFEVCTGGTDGSGEFNSLLILNPSGTLLYEDVLGCTEDVFSSDGVWLYRDGILDGTSFVTQAISMAGFENKTIDNYINEIPYDEANNGSDVWMAADSTGMVYGVNTDLGGQAAFQAIDTATNAALPSIDNPLPISIVQIFENAGSPSGGDTIDLLCTGLDTLSAFNVEVEIGGHRATSEFYSGPGPGGSGFSHYAVLTVNTPPGKLGPADVTLITPFGTATVPKGFTYTYTPVSYSLKGSPSFLLYDSGRQLLYAANGKHVDVVNPATRKVLSPLVPKGAIPNSASFGGISLSPDGNRLWVADVGANQIYMIDLAKPSASYTIDPTKALASSTPVTPGRVVELSDGTLVGSAISLETGLGQLFSIDLATKSGSWAQDASGNMIHGLVWNASSSGDAAVLSQAGSTDPEGVTYPQNIGLWLAGSGPEIPGNDNIAGVNYPTPVALDGDGNLVGFGAYSSQFFDSGLNYLGQITFPTEGVPTYSNLQTHPSGALIYRSGWVNTDGGPAPSVVEIEDVISGQHVATVDFPVPLSQSGNDAADIYIQNLLAVDSTGKYLFASTSNGVVQMELPSVPLSIGHLQPDWFAEGGQEVTVRGSGFESGAVASFGGKAVETKFVNSNTLTATLPELAPGWFDVTVALPGGARYTASGLLHIAGGQSTPVLKSLSPASMPLAQPTPNEPPITITLVGASFTDADTALLNCQAVGTKYVDSNHLRAAIAPSEVTQAGSLIFSVVSPYTGSSNSLIFAVVNPKPAIQQVFPNALPLGASSASLDVFGTGFLPGSVVLVNGTPLPTKYGPTFADFTDQPSLQVSVPGSLLNKAGSLTLTVQNLAPGGGLSKQFGIQVANAAPSITFPASLDLGIVPPGSSGGGEPLLYNLGSAPYTPKSIKIEGAGFSPSQIQCTNIAPGKPCNIVVKFAPTHSAKASGSLIISDDLPGSPHTIALTGTGIVPPPVVTFVEADSSGFTNLTTNAYGQATVFGEASEFAELPLTAWLEYTTDPTFKTYSKSPPWSITVDPGPTGMTLGIYTQVTGLKPKTKYAGRLAVQMPSGIGRSNVLYFTTQAAEPNIQFSFPYNVSNQVTLYPGRSASVSINESYAQDPWDGAATLSCANLPPGVTCSVSPPQVSNGSNDVPLTIGFSATSSAPQGNYYVFVIATVGGEQAAAIMINLQVP